MKHLQTLRNGVLTFLAALFATFTAVAQDAKLDVNVNSNSGGFFASPWVWVIGAAVFILLLVALMRGGNTREA